MAMVGPLVGVALVGHSHFALVVGVVDHSHPDGLRMVVWAWHILELVLDYTFVGVSDHLTTEWVAVDTLLDPHWGVWEQE